MGIKVTNITDLMTHPRKGFLEHRLDQWKIVLASAPHRMAPQCKYLQEGLLKILLQ